jgi:hypothetical protein
MHNSKTQVSGSFTLEEPQLDKSVDTVTLEEVVNHFKLARKQLNELYRLGVTFAEMRNYRYDKKLGW